jgi:hypothetical protein
MLDIPHPWGEYARLQARMSRNSTIDSYSWGTEEEMNLFLDDPSGFTAADAGRVQRFRDVTARRERFRAKLRKVHEAELAPVPVDPIPHLEARDKLATLESWVTPGQWALAMAVAQGFDYAEISLKQAISVGAARAQLCRLRQQFLHLRPAA